MHAFHTARGIQHQRGRGRRDKEGRDYIRCCFADPAIAADFASAFSGSIVA